MPPAMDRQEFRVGQQIVEDDRPLVARRRVIVIADDEDRDVTELLGENLGTAKDAVQEGRRIATLRHEQLGLSVATAFMSA